MNRLRACVIAGLGSFVPLAPYAVAPLAAQPHTSVIDIGTLGPYPYQASALRAVNNRNEAVGWSEIFGSDTDHAILWRNGQLIDLGVPAFATASSATSINERGQVVGLGLDYLLARAHAVRWDDGVITELTLPGAHSCYASDINNRGVVAGTCDQVPLLWARDDTAIRLALPVGFTAGTASAINDAGVVVGSVGSPDSPAQPVLWRHGSPVLLPLPAGATAGAATDVNARGEVVGYVRTAAGSEPTLWIGNRPVPLSGAWGTFFGEARSINDRGEVTVLGAEPGAAFGDYVWRDGVLQPLPGLGYGVAINNRGVVVGEIDSGDGVIHGAIWPKPLTRVAPAAPRSVSLP